MSQNEQGLAKLVRHRALPFTFDVTDIEPAINQLADVIAALTGPREPFPVIRPPVLVDHTPTPAGTSPCSAGEIRASTTDSAVQQRQAGTVEFRR